MDTLTLAWSVELFVVLDAEELISISDKELEWNPK